MVNGDKIDFIITWVDGNDPAWRQESNRYAGIEQKDVDNSECRSREWGTLKY
jgi:hypothetical protein